MATTMTPTDYTSGGKTIACEVYTPTAVNGGVVVIAYGSDGMIDNTRGPWATMLRQYARDLAANGFTAIIPDYFLRTGPAAGSIDYQKGGAQIVVMNRDSWVSGLQDAVTHAKTLAGIDPKRVGLLGFSLGGHLGLRCARPLKCSRSFLRRCSTVSAPAAPAPACRCRFITEALIRPPESGIRSLHSRQMRYRSSRNSRERERPPSCTSMWAPGTGSWALTPRTRALRHSRRHAQLLSSSNLTSERPSGSARWLSPSCL